MISEALRDWLRADAFRREMEAEARGESLAKPPLEPLSPEQFEENLLAHGIIDWRQVE